MAKGWTTVAVKDELVARLDAFLDKNTWGFTSRGDVIATAVREFLERRARDEGRSIFEPGQDSTPKGSASKTESAKRQ